MIRLESFHVQDSMLVPLYPCPMFLVMGRTYALCVSSSMSSNLLLCLVSCLKMAWRLCQQRALGSLQEAGASVLTTCSALPAAAAAAAKAAL